jgi:predicted PurR-regulated permease PerM
MLPEMREFLSDRPYTFDRVVRLVLSLGILALLALALGYFADVLLPFAVALMLAYLMNPLVGLIGRKVRHRGAAVALSVLAVAVALIVLGLVLVPMIGAELAHTGDVLGQMVQKSPLADKIAGHLPPDRGRPSRTSSPGPRSQAS